MNLTAALLFLCTTLLPQALPDGMDLLRQSGNAFSRLHSYQYELEMVTDMVVAGSPVSVTMRNSVAAINPDKRRVETRSQMSGARSTIVSDGTCTWFYNSALNQYAKRVASQRFQPLDASFGLGQMPEPARLFTDVRTVRDQTIEAGGKKYDCWLVEARIEKFAMAQPAGTTLSDCAVSLWITKDRNMIMRTTLAGKMQGSAVAGNIDVRQKMTTVSLTLNADLPSDLFSFKAPAGAREVEEFDTPSLRKPDLAGRPAPEFHVMSLAGKTYDLAGMKGKVVLLNFWASWCGPCRQEMVDLGKVQEQYRDSEFTLIGLNIGEDRATVESYLKKAGVTHAIGLTEGTNMAYDYKVSALPTYVLIDRDGTVVGYQIGSNGQAALRTLLSKAGLKPIQDR